MAGLWLSIYFGNGIIIPTDGKSSFLIYCRISWSNTMVIWPIFSHHGICLNEPVTSRGVTGITWMGVIPRSPSFSFCSWIMMSCPDEHVGKWMKMDENGGFHHEFHGILVGSDGNMFGNFGSNEIIGRSGDSVSKNVDWFEKTLKIDRIFHGRSWDITTVAKQKQTRGFSQTWDLMGMFHKNAMGFIFPQQQYLAGGFKHEFYCPWYIGNHPPTIDELHHFSTKQIRSLGGSGNGGTMDRQLVEIRRTSWFVQSGAEQWAVR